jgi:O-antigen/teichoic acid export membrane protein
MIERIDVLLLAPLLGVQSVGYYTAAYRIAAILNFFPIIIGQVVAANIAIAYYRSDIGSLRRVFHQALFARGMLALPLTIALFVFARPLVHLIYGVAFDPAVSLLRLLLVGQAINCATGPVGAVLTMAGRERTFAIINICSAMFAVVFCYLGIRWMGLNGAGLAASSTLALLNLAQFVAVRSIISTKVAESKHKL